LLYLHLHWSRSLKRTIYSSKKFPFKYVHHFLVHSG
jgi:hypothetical protein